MHPTQMHGWSPYQPSSPMPGRRQRVPGGVRHQLTIGLVLFAAAFLLPFGLLRTEWGWWAVVLAWAVVGLLARRWAEGWRQWCKALAEYTVVAALAVVLAAAVITAAASAPAPKAKPKPKAKAATEQADPWAGLGARFAELRERLPRVEVTTDKEGR